MKCIKYSLYQGKNEDGTDILIEKIVGYNEVNEEIAKKEAYNPDDIIIFDDGQPEPEKVETTDDILNALLGVI